MRQLISALIVCSCVTLIVLISIGCSAAPESGVMTIDCEFAFRDTTVGDGEKAPEMKREKITVEIEIHAGEHVEIGRIIEPEKLELGNFRVEILPSSDSLIVRVIDKETDKQITSTLFQFGSDLKNQFHGSHGFSGLNYVYHPKNESELLFWCKKKSFVAEEAE